MHLRGTFVVSRPACRYWRAQAKEHGSTYGRLINTATGLLVYGGAGQSNYVAAKAGVQAFTEAVATEMAPYGVTANTIMPGANTRLAQIGWRMSRQAVDRARRRRRRSTRAIRCTSPSSRRYLASPAAGWISGQTFQVRGGIVEHIATWQVRDTAQRFDRGLHRRRLRARDPALVRRRREARRSAARGMASVAEGFVTGTRQGRSRSPALAHVWRFLAGVAPLPPARSVGAHPAR